MVVFPQPTIASSLFYFLASWEQKSKHHCCLSFHLPSRHFNGLMVIGQGKHKRWTLYAFSVGCHVFFFWVCPVRMVCTFMPVSVDTLNRFLICTLNSSSKRASLESVSCPAVRIVEGRVDQIHPRSLPCASLRLCFKVAPRGCMGRETGVCKHLTTPQGCCGKDFVFHNMAQVLVQSQASLSSGFNSAVCTTLWALESAIHQLNSGSGVHP